MHLTPEQRDASVGALAYLTAFLDDPELAAELFSESCRTHDGSVQFALGLANVAGLLAERLGDATGGAEELVYQGLGLDLQQA